MPLACDRKVTKSGGKARKTRDEQTETRDEFKLLDGVCPSVRIVENWKCWLVSGTNQHSGTVYFVDSSTLWTMGRTFLGEFEQRVLLAILRCDANASPIEIRREIARASGHDPSRGAFYTTLDRLEQKGLLRSHLGDPLPERGGRARRYYTVSTRGLASLRAARESIDGLSAGVTLEPKQAPS